MFNTIDSHASKALAILSYQALMIITLTLSACEEPKEAVQSTEIDMNLIDFALIGTGDLSVQDTLDLSRPLDDDAMILDMEIHDLSMIDLSEESDGEVNDDGFITDDEGPPRDPAPERGVDEDHDGLEDYWEWSLNDTDRFDPTNSDSDGDGILDGAEDEDGDGLSAAQEYSLGAWIDAQSGESVFSAASPTPFERDLLVQIDEMEGYELDLMALPMVLESFSSLRALDRSLEVMSELKSYAVNVHIIIDELVEERVLQGDFESRHQLLRSTAGFSDRLIDLGLGEYSDHLIHVVTANERLDEPSRAGEAVNHPDRLDSSGLIIYLGTISAQHPSCGIDSPPPVPFVETYEAQAGTLTHELGHALQLGHDTALNSGINPYNVMSVITGCVSARQRYHGEGNQDHTLGSTETSFSPRFSAEAALLMRFDAKLSVDVSTLENSGRGYDH